MSVTRRFEVWEALRMFSCMGETVFFAFAFTFLFYQIFEVLSNGSKMDLRGEIDAN